MLGASGDQQRENAMAVTSIRCTVLGANVMRVTNLAGNVTKIICSEYVPATGTCRLKKNVLDEGPLSQLLERFVQETSDTRSLRCTLQVT
jgi:hypothetical protein